MLVENIKKRCAERGISLARLEKETEIGNGVIGKWAKPGRGASLYTLKKIADYFGCSVDDLLDDE